MRLTLDQVEGDEFQLGAVLRLSPPPVFASELYGPSRLGANEDP